MLRFRKNLGIGVLLLGVCFAGAACRRDMQDQPKMKPYRGTSFFSDGLSSRPPVKGTIPRGFLRTDKAFFTGKKDSATTGGTATPSASPQAGGSGQPATGANAYPDDVTEFPFPVTKETVLR